jgi:hypothetical protein
MAHRLDQVRRDESGPELLASFLVEHLVGSEAAAQVASDAVGPEAGPRAAAQSAWSQVWAPLSNLLKAPLLPVVAPRVQRVRCSDVLVSLLAPRDVPASQRGRKLQGGQVLAPVASERLPDPLRQASRLSVAELLGLPEPQQGEAESPQDVRRSVEQPQQAVLAALRRPECLARPRDEPSREPASELEPEQLAAPVSSPRRTSLLPPPLPARRDRGNASAPTRLYRDRANSNASSFR